MTDQLESQLRAWGAAQREAAGPPPPGLLDRATEAERHGRPRWTAVAAAAAAVLAVSMGGMALQLDRSGRSEPSTPSTSTTTTATPTTPTPIVSVVPWADLPPVATGDGASDPMPSGAAMRALTASLELPDEATAGDVLTYTVTLTNPTNSDIELDPCPSFSQVIGGAEVNDQRNRLNCREAGPIPAQGALAFAMEIALPDELPEGELLVHWIFDPAGQSAEGTVWVNGAPSPTAAAIPCGPGVERLPCGAGLVVGESYPYKIRTHCGIEGLYADGRYWVPLSGQNLGDHNPPPGYDDPDQVGTLAVVAADRVEFKPSTGGATLSFRPGTQPDGECN